MSTGCRKQIVGLPAQLTLELSVAIGKESNKRGLLTVHVAYNFLFSAHCKFYASILYSF